MNRFIKRLNSRDLSVAAAMVVICVIARLLPHPPNFTPVASLALFGGAYFASKRLALLVPMTAMLVSDLLLGFHTEMWAVYGCMAASVFLGRWLASSPQIGRGIFAVTSGSVLFFVVTNFAFWLQWYDPTIAGLIACYTMALPFFQYTLSGDLFFSALIFAAAKLAMPSLQIRQTAVATKAAA